MERNLAKISQAEMDKVNVDLAAAGVAFKERYNMLNRILSNDYPRSKFLAVILLVLLPIQFVWGAATGYCQHETRTSDTHFGHHVHEHQAKLATRLKDSAEVDRSIGGDHPDCPSCHLTSVSAVLDQVPLMTGSHAGPLAFADEQSHPSFLRHRIERPNWRRAA